MLSKEHSFSEKACSNVKWILKTTAYQHELSFAWWYDSKNRKQINLTLKAALIADDLNVAYSTFCCCNKQYVSSWLMKDLLMVRCWKASRRGMLVLRVVPILKTHCAQWWLNDVFMNSAGVKNPGAVMTSSLYQQNLQSTRKNLAQSYFVGTNSDATSVT